MARSRAAQPTSAASSHRAPSRWRARVRRSRQALGHRATARHQDGALACGAADKRSGMKPELRHVSIRAAPLVRAEALVFQREPPVASALANARALVGSATRKRASLMARPLALS
jgi:hypothetical protein